MAVRRSTRVRSYGKRDGTHVSEHMRDFKVGDRFKLNGYFKGEQGVITKKSATDGIPWYEIKLDNQPNNRYEISSEGRYKKMIEKL